MIVNQIRQWKVLLLWINCNTLIVCRHWKQKSVKIKLMWQTGVCSYITYSMWWIHVRFGSVCILQTSVMQHVSNESIEKRSKCNGESMQLLVSTYACSWRTVNYSHIAHDTGVSCVFCCSTISGHVVIVRKWKVTHFFPHLSSFTAWICFVLTPWLLLPGYSRAEALCKEYRQTKGPGTTAKPSEQLFFLKLGGLIKNTLEKCQRENGFM